MQILISVSPRAVGRVMTVAALLVTLASMAGDVLGDTLGYDRFWIVTRLFDLDEEGNISSFYQASTLLLCSILLAVIAHVSKVTSARYLWHWWLLSAVFLFMAVDEAAQIHEGLVTPIVSLFRGVDGQEEGTDKFYWLIPYVALLFIFALSYARFLLHLPPRVRTVFIVAGAVYTGGAVIVEMLAGYYERLYGDASVVYRAITNTSELMEMLGVVLVSTLC